MNNNSRLLRRTELVLIAAWIAQQEQTHMTSWSARLYSYEDYSYTVDHGLVWC